MARVPLEPRRLRLRSQDETAALIFENAELRKKATELMLEMCIMRETLMLRQPVAGVDRID